MGFQSLVNSVVKISFVNVSANFLGTMELLASQTTKFYWTEVNCVSVFDMKFCSKALNWRIKTFSCFSTTTFFGNILLLLLLHGTKEDVSCTHFNPQNWFSSAVCGAERQCCFQFIEWQQLGPKGAAFWRERLEERHSSPGKDGLPQLPREEFSERQQIGKPNYPNRNIHVRQKSSSFPSRYLFRCPGYVTGTCTSWPSAVTRTQATSASGQSISRNPTTGHYRSSTHSTGIPASTSARSPPLRTWATSSISRSSVTYTNQN